MPSVLFLSFCNSCFPCEISGAEHKYNCTLGYAFFYIKCDLNALYYIRMRFALSVSFDGCVWFTDLFTGEELELE